jgi:hypothetical protein
MASFTNDEITDVLVKSRDLITPKGSWTQRTMARDRHGSLVAPRSWDATCWCMSGAVLATCGAMTERYWEVMSVIARTIDPTSTHAETTSITFNDDDKRKQTEVIDVFNRAIGNLSGTA